MDLLQELTERRRVLMTEIDYVDSVRQAMIAGAETAQRQLSADEVAQITEGNDLLRTKRGEVAEFDERIFEVADQALKAARAAQAVTALGGTAAVGLDIRVKREPLTYRRQGEHSYFRDLLMAHTRRGKDVGGAEARLLRHAQEMDVEMVEREARREAQAEKEMRSLGQGSVFERRVNPNRTDGQGGYFVPPIYLIDEFAALARAGRTFANSVRQLILPEGTDSINVPKVATGSTAAIQTADAAGVSSTDITDAIATAGVKTIAGQQDIALQLLEQSPIAFDDQVIFPDLVADYNMKLDVQCLSGSNAAGQVQGIDGLAGTNAVSYVDATPTGPELYLPLAQALSNVATNRFLPATALFFHSRRWYWLASQLDTQNRPLVVPVSNGPFNPEALQTGLVAEGPAGQVLGAPILLDPNIRTNAGGGTEDRIYAVRTSDIYLWEGNLRTRVLMEVLSGTLQVRLQVYNYVAFMPDRYPKSISVVSGTGLAAPAGF